MMMTGWIGPREQTCACNKCGTGCAEGVFRLGDSHFATGTNSEEIHPRIQVGQSHTATNSARGFLGGSIRLLSEQHTLAQYYETQRTRKYTGEGLFAKDPFVIEIHCKKILCRKAVTHMDTYQAKGKAS